MIASQRFSLVLALGACFALAGCETNDSGDSGTTDETDGIDGTDPEETPSGGQGDGESDADALVAERTAVMHRRIAANNTQDWATWESLHTEDAVRTAPELDGPLVGAKAMRAGIEELFVTFPDYHLELVETFGEGDRLMARIHTRATMLGPMDIGGVTIAPTGMAFEQDWVAVLTFDGDQISAIDEFHDNYGILIQLGLAE